MVAVAAGACPQFSRSMTVLETIVATLQASEEPLHYKEIARRISKSGLYTFAGTTPEATVAGVLSLATRRIDSPIRRMGEGFYAVGARKTATEPSLEGPQWQAKADSLLSCLGPRLRSLMDERAASDPDLPGIAALYEQVVVEELGDSLATESESDNPFVGFLRHAGRGRAVWKRWVDRLSEGRTSPEALAELEQGGIGPMLDQIALDVVEDWLRYRYDLAFSFLTDRIGVASAAAEMVLAACRVLAEEGIDDARVERAMRRVADNAERQSMLGGDGRAPRVRLVLEDLSEEARIRLQTLTAASGGSIADVMKQALDARLRELGVVGRTSATGPEAKRAQARA